jgi:hypothetical protein
VLTVLLAIVAAAPADFLPCTPGLAITYAFIGADGKDTGATMVETVRGQGDDARMCIIDQLTQWPDGKTQRDAWAREMLEDRVVNAGWVGSLTAFRPPILVGPLDRGKKWVFNRTRFEIAEVGTTFDVPAGTFDGCVRIVETSIPAGAHSAWSVYAPGVGLIATEVNGRQRRATRVVLPKTDKPTAQQPRR